jgi:hypothetical protein
MPVYASAGQYQVLGLAIFAFAYVTTIPSWANEKRAGVSVNAAVWWPAAVGTVLKVGGGVLGAFAFRLVEDNGNARAGMEDILNRLVESDMPVVTVYSAYLWNISTLIPGIPVLAIMVRYNLVNSGAAGPKLAFFVGVVAPWLVTMFCYQAEVLVAICNWSALLTIGVVNLVVPIAVYHKALVTYSRAAEGTTSADAIDGGALPADPINQGSELWKNVHTPGGADRQASPGRVFR